MDIPGPLLQGKLVKRYKRFLADITLDNGELITAHCANTGSMLQCKEPGSRVVVSFRDNPKRKLKYTWEMVEINDSWSCINTMLPNKIVQEAVEQGLVAELSGYNTTKPEVKYGKNSRIDLLLSDPVDPSMTDMCYVEVKNVTLTDDDSTAIFPDSVTTRGHKHLQELIDVVEAGGRGVMFYTVQRSECQSFRIAEQIDPEYNRLFNKARQAGVEMLAYKVMFKEPNKLVVDKRLSVIFNS